MPRVDMSATMRSLNDYAAGRMVSVKRADGLVVEIPKSTYDRHYGRRMTRQGVPDLNGPRMNGTGYNGHKSATCAHHRAPDVVPTHVVEVMEVALDDYGLATPFMITVRYTHCSSCGQRMFKNEG